MRILGGNGLAAFFGALALIFSIRNVQPESWAYTAVVIGLGPSLGLVLSLGSVAFQTRRLSRITNIRLRRSEYAIYLSRRFVVSLPWLVLGVGLIALEYKIVGLISLIAGLRFFRGGTSVLLASAKRFGSVSVLSAFEKFVNLLFVLIAHWFGVLDWMTLPWAFALSYLVFIGGSFTLERPCITRRIFSIAFRSPMRVWSKSSRFGVTSLVGPIQQADVSIMTLVSDTLQAGFLGAGSRLTTALNLPGGSLAAVILPYFSRKEESIGGSLRHGSSLLYMALAYALGLITAALTTSFWVPLVLGEQYAPASTVVGIYLMIVCIQTFMQPLLVLLQARDAEAKAMWIAIIQMSGIISTTVLMGYYWGAIGAAFGQLCVAFLCVILALVTVLRLRKIEQKFLEVS